MSDRIKGFTVVYCNNNNSTHCLTDFDDLYVMCTRKNVSFGVRDETVPHLGVISSNPILGAWICRLLSSQHYKTCILLKLQHQFNQILHHHEDH